MYQKHTPGPWETEDEYVQQAGKPDVGICSVMNMDLGGDKGWFRGPETEANARLIAAAPDLLSATIQVEAILAQIIDQPSDTLNKLRAAIAKATGGST